MKNIKKNYITFLIKLIIISLVLCCILVAGMKLCDLLEIGVLLPKNLIDFSFEILSSLIFISFMIIVFGSLSSLIVNIFFIYFHCFIRKNQHLIIYLQKIFLV